MASKSKRRRKVLGASCILAALIIAGSSFAWFTSKDEVTNRLTATADYGTSIVEDFSPPKAMTPGENVNKDVSVVNTGSIDAFTRVALENQLTITTYDKDDFTINNFTDTTKPYYTINKETVTYGPANGATQSDVSVPANSGNTTYAAYQDTVTSQWGLKTTVTEELSEHYATTAARDADETVFDASYPDDGFDNVAGSTVYNFVDGSDGTDTSIKECDVSQPTSGTIDKAVKLSTSQSLNSETGKLTPNEVTTLQAGGTIVMAGNDILSKAEQFVVAGDDTTPPTQKDYDGSGQYKPTKTGLYIFKRTVYEGDGNNKTEYSGYYFVKSGTDLDDGSGVTVTTTEDAFYALKTKVTETATGSVATPYIDFGKHDVLGIMTPYDGFKLDSDGQITTIEGTVSLLTKSTYKTAGIGGVSGTDLATVTPSFGKLVEDNSAGDSWTPATSSTEYNDPAKVNAVKLTIATEAGANDTVIYIKLADGWTTNWKVVEPSGAADSVADWFYYKDTVKSGKTTEKLVDYVRIDNKTNQTNYVDLVYDLNVVLESAQVTHNDEGDETATAVPTATWATPTLTTTPVNNNGNVSVITAVDWNS